MSEQKLVVKLSEIMTEVQRIAKRGHNDFHKYDYATESDITAAIREHLAQRKIMILPRVVKWTQHEKTSAKGEISYLVYTEMVFAITDGETGEVLECPWLGCGEDKGDKSVYKSLTGALKYFLLKLFMIPTGDDPERDRKKKSRDERQEPHQDAPVAPRAPTQATGPSLSQSEVEAVFAAAKRAGYKNSGELKPFVVQMFGVEKVSEVPKDGLRRLINAITQEPEVVAQ